MKEKKLNDLILQLNFECIAGERLLNRTINAAYVSDLLSDVMGNAHADMLWITAQVHKNIIAVASLKDLSAIIVTSERTPVAEVIACAEQEEVVLILSQMSTYETTGKVYNFLNDIE